MHTEDRMFADKSASSGGADVNYESLLRLRFTETFCDPDGHREYFTSDWGKAQRGAGSPRTLEHRGLLPAGPPSVVTQFAAAAFKQNERKHLSKGEAALLPR